MTEKVWKKLGIIPFLKVSEWDIAKILHALLSGWAIKRRKTGGLEPRKHHRGRVSDSVNKTNINIWKLVYAERKLHVYN